MEKTSYKDTKCYPGLQLWESPLHSIPDLRVGVYYHQSCIVNIHTAENWVWMAIVFNGRLFTKQVDNINEITRRKIANRAKYFVSEIINPCTT